MMSRRGEFPVRVKRALAARAGHVCSFPGCGRPTSGPSSEGPEASVNLGEACHIVAAAAGPGARRADPGMSEEELRSIENGIWMCRTHAKLIDSDEATYTVEQLREWKRYAEHRAERRLRGASAAALTASRLYGIPRSPSMRFVGRREELDRLEQLLLHSTAVRIAASVEGLPGIGKTELALQLVFELARDGAFPGGIFWFDAEDPDLTATWGGVIADALEVPTGPREERAAQTVRTLSQKTAPTLLVLDNVERWTVDQKPSPLPEGMHLRFLVTTRQRRLGGTSFEHVDVGFLDESFTRRLIEGVAGRELQNSPGFDDLVEHLGGHALACELAGAFLSVYEDETSASYLEQLRAQHEIEAEVSELVRYNHTVHQAFQTLWNRLDDEIRDAWRLASCFEPEPVTRELSETVGLTPQLRRQLQRLHLIDVTEEGRWWMHRLTREFGQRSGTGAELAASQEAFVKGCSEFAQQIKYPTGFRPYLANRMQLDNAATLAPKVLGSEDAQISNLQNSLGIGLMSAGDFRRALRMFEQALESALENLGEHHPSVATIRSNLAGVLMHLGKLCAARKLLEQALESALENLGEHHPSVATRRSALALVLKDLGELCTARKLLEQALQADVKILGKDHPSVARSRSNLAGVLMHLGELSAARKLLEQALESGLKILGGDHPSVATIRFNLAMAYREEGHSDRARDSFQAALKVIEPALGRDHPHVALTRARLAETFQRLGEVESARDEARKALQAVSDQPEGSSFRVDVERVTASILLAPE
ncbi:MAG: tetratricopeptide repeat protein [Acidobacteriota bacterium]